ncbi:hypothetical protein DO659_26220, partial [Salmonella enterica subsp. enterica serovar Minnesota]|nr:hypothetical protein [Salmonella enterica subsp. enterica serovar Minnesota]
NTTINVTNDINVTAVGGMNINSTLTSQAGNITLNTLQGDVKINGALNAGGDITLGASQGNMNISENVTAGNNITLNTTQGQITLTGNNNLAAVNDISVVGDNIKLTNTSLSSSQGNITVSGMKGGSQHTGVAMGGNVNLQALQGDITVNASSSSYGVSSHDPYKGYSKPNDSGGLNFDQGNFTFSAKDTEINASGVYNRGIQSGLWAGGIIFNPSSNVNFNGNATINASSPKSFGIWYASQTFGGTLYNFNVNSGDVVLNTSGSLGGVGFELSWANYNPLYKVNYNVAGGASLTINASSTSGSGIGSGSYNNLHFSDPSSAGSGGLAFTGAGNVMVFGSSQSGNGVNSRYLDNTGLTGNMTVQGTSVSGNGVYVDRNTTYKLKNATITGSSQRGAGIKLSGTTVRNV